VESDTEEEETLEERDAAPLRIRFPGDRARVGPPEATIPAPIDLENEAVYFGGAARNYL